MNQFWIATAVFVVLGLTPIVVASIANGRQRRAVRTEGQPR
ncbi:MAG: hypothetical protein ACRDO7_11730 [Nocardioidaceae bacterium]